MKQKNESYTIGFVDGLDCTKHAIINKLKDAIQNGTIIVASGTDKIFEIIESVGKVD